MSTVLIFGASCLDYVARVSHFPQPDEKLRTDALTICGGGNAANTTTCLSRLGIKVKLIAKIGDDINGKKILEDHQKEDNIDTTFLIIRSSTVTPLAYVIVDTQTKTRTCLFSGINEQILIDDVDVNWLNNIKFAHFDSRSTEAAVYLAKLAKDKSILCSLDLERERPHLNELIPLMDYIITTENYSRNVRHDSNCIQTAVHFLRTCKFVIITRGKNGSILVEKYDGNSSNGCKNHISHGSIVTKTIERFDEEDFVIWTCTAWPIEEKDIIDTTGCGDAFIGGILYGLLSNEIWSKDKLLRFASYIAMCKIKGTGARSSLPYLSDIDMNLFF